jgi:hypothetical protein
MNDCFLRVIGIQNMHFPNASVGVDEMLASTAALDTVASSMHARNGEQSAVM